MPKQSGPDALPHAPIPRVAAVLREVERNASKKFRVDMSARYGIVTSAVTYGTPVAKLKIIAKKIGRDHSQG
ncbi:MAG: hypothetical protein H7X95_11630 [Deltaproteobacteria bacterium]|nr:hypothetical protein [Deltaproteobacteria bacterium]